MSAWFKKDLPPASPKRCSQCDADMDVGESVCAQCGHGLKEHAERERNAEIERRARTPIIKLPALASPSARRLYIRGKTLGKAIAPRWVPPWLARFLLLANVHPEPPSARRVVARAMVLAAVVARASLEQLANPDKTAADLFSLVKDLGIAREVELQERAFLKTRFGRVDKALAANHSWRAEGLAVLAWALDRFQLPAYDEAVVPIAAQDSVGFANRELASELLDAGVLRPSSEIERFATHATLVTWRLRTFHLYPGPWDFVGHLRRQASFKEAWLENLRILDGDLVVGAQSIANAPAEEVQRCERIAVERQIAAYWLQGDDPAYSKVDPATLLSAC